MGFNISGLIIENNFGKSIQKVSENLEIGFEMIEECESYEATESINEKDKVFVIFTELATIIFYEPEHYNRYLYSQTSNSLNFQYFETAMIFAIRYVRDCELLRAIESIDNKIIYSSGRKLKAEIGTNGVDEIVVNLAEQISGITILGIKEEIKVIKCKLIEYVGKRTRKSEQEIQTMITERRISRNLGHGYDTFRYE